MLRFDSNAMYLHMYTTVLMVSLMAHLHIIISIKSPCFIAPAFATEARVLSILHQALNSVHPLHTYKEKTKLFKAMA